MDYIISMMHEPGMKILIELKDAIMQHNNSLRNVRERKKCSCIVGVVIILTDTTVLWIFVSVCVCVYVVRVYYERTK